MKKAFVILLSALLVLSFFVACSGEAEDMFGMKVSFDGNGSTSGSMSPVLVKMGEKIILPANSYARTGYVFNGWNTRSDGTGTPYADKARSGFKENTTLYAQWLEIYPITEDTTILYPGNYYTTVGPETVVSESIIIGNGTGEVFIILAEGTTLEALKGIAVMNGETLNITGSGKLVATGDGGSAGIGGTGTYGNSGTINISGGTIIATGGLEAAGIGGGVAGDGGIVSISGGDVTANGGLSGGAGIGGGKGGDGAIVSITGGTVNAFGSEQTVTVNPGCGIGAGVGGSYDGTLEIGEGLGLFGGDDAENAKFLSGPTDSYVGENFRFMGTEVSVLVKIVFDANGGEGEMAPQAVVAGIPAELNVNLFDKGDMFFKEWTTEKGGTGTSYKDMDNITTDVDVTLYAQWTDVPPFVYLDSNTTVLEDGNYYTITDNLVLENRLVVEGNAKIYLPDGMTLTAPKGITVSRGMALEINAYGTEGSGKLVANNGLGIDAAIGGTSDTTITSNTKGAGTIVIKGGVIEATAADGGAAIGGAEGGTGGRITITGGDITARGGDGAAGIGGGYKGSGVIIVISGGNVTAYGMDTGAGIGGGGLGTAGVINISGGTVNAFAGHKGAAIGGGYECDGGRITISGGTVYATGSDSVGIGSGKDCDTEGILTIGSGIGLYGGADKASATFLSAPTESYEGTRALYMETKETEYAVVTFKPNGGKETEDKQQEIPMGIATALEANTFTHATYEFDNWNEKPDASSAEYADKQVVTLDKDLTLYAHWVEEIPLDNSYGGDTGKKLKSGKSYTITDDLEITGRLMIEGRKPVTIIIPKGKTLTLSKGLNVTDKQNLVIEGEGTLIANATDNSGDAAIGGNSDAGAGIITINGGTVIATGSEGAAAIGKGKGGSSDGTLKIGDGMGLYGGADKASATFISSPVEEYEGERYVFMEAKPTEYATITFDANGGKGTMKDQIVPKSIAIALNANEFKHDTLNFAGWVKDPESTTKDYGNKGTIEIESDITLYALWLPVIPLDASYGGEGKKLEGGNQYTIDGDLTIAGRLYIEGTGAVTIILPEKGTLTLSSGLEVVEGQSLIIEGEGDGTLIAKGVSSGDAGIGGSKGASGGTITIKGGTVTATGAGGTGTDGGGAGIGGGHKGSGGTVIISGGTVTATGGGAGEFGGGGAGIGSGHNPGSLGSVSGGTITISGGTVNATGGATNNGRGGAGLGGGNYADGADVSITGGTVTATAAPGTVGIGAGKDSTKHGSLEIGDGQGLFGGADKDNVAFLSAPTESYEGERPLYMETKATTYVTVTFDANGGKGTMDAQSVPKDVGAVLNANVFEKTDMYFAGWNTKSDGSGDSYSDKGSINIGSDTTLYAQWTDGVLLDDSYGGEGKKLEGGQKYTIVDDLTLSGRLGISGLSNVTIVLPKDKTLTLSEGISVIAGQGLTIEGKGSLIATGSADCAAIGGINANAGGTVTINGGIITATGGSRAAGIGGGYGAKGGTVTINGGTINATGGSKAAGIGRGYGGDSDGTLKIGDGMGLFGGADKDNVAFLSAPVDSYTGDRPAYMETMATTYVTVKFDANGGTGSMSDQTMPSGFATDLTKNTFSKDDLTFGGWALSSTGDYKYADQEKITITAGLTLYAQWVANPTVLTGSETTLAAGTSYTIDSDLVFSAERLSLSGTDPVTIIVPKDKTLTLSKGISVISGQTLIIKGAGTLIATGTEKNAAIGGTSAADGGNVKIYSGIIQAQGISGAGIGGGCGKGSGNIYIYGGKVTARGGQDGAGIGSAYYASTQTIEISGGEVTAYGGGGCAGIGGGYSCGGGNVIITGGIVKATHGGGEAMGIGRGANSSNPGSLKIGEGLALFGGGSKDNAVFLSGPVASYSGSRYAYMGTEAAVMVTISFNANGGTGTMPDQTAASGFAAKLPENTFVNGDWYFGGWASTKTGDIEYENNEAITVNGNTTLYAKWVDAIPISSKTSTLDGGKKYTIDASLTNNNRLSINGTEAAIIDLPAGKTLTLPNGINVPEGKSLIIRGEGTLTASASGDTYNAAIGGNERQTAGTITIEGGIVNATGSKWGGAGIGGGGGDARTSDYYRGGDGGTINILGGTVTSTGGSGGGAGIGGGSYAKEGGTISIEGGSVTALSVSGAAAIGGGAYGCNGGTITISGKDTIVDATGGADAGAGIGGGKEGGAGGTITISGGTVTARGGESAYTSGGGAAGIGGGSGTSSYPGGAGGTITISGGDVTAIGNRNAAGIGGGGSFSDTKGGAGGTVNITGGTVKATGGSASRAIGKGEGKNLAGDGTLIIGSNMGLYGGTSQSNEKFLTKPVTSWPDDADHRPAFMEAKPTDYVTISFDGNGGAGEMASQLMVKDFAFYDLTANKFTTPDEGKIFIGWATSATGDVVYSDEGTIAFDENKTLYAKWGTDVVITDSLKKLVAGHNHVHTADVTNNNRLYIVGGDSATITLTEGKKLTLTKGINVPKGKTLTIEGTGSLMATGGTQQAGIGGNDKQNGGKIIINSGTITANGNDRAAGIGAGGASDGEYGYAGGEVIINGGDVTANGGSSGGAGIGGGKGPTLCPTGAGGTVTINGGTVKANGGSSGGAGIGGGPGTTGQTTIILTVKGGTVTAIGAGGGAGIGGSKDYAGGNVTIEGGTVVATGGVNVLSDSGMGIGHGSSSQGGSTNNGTLTLTGVAMEVSDNGSDWSTYVTDERHRYMKTK